jgi:hypothetical protein
MLVSESSSDGSDDNKLISWALSLAAVDDPRGKASASETATF